MKKTILFLYSILLSLVIHSASAGFNEALDAYSKKDYPKAFKEFQSLAQIGESRSQLNLGVMYYLGQGVPKDINKAYAWIRIGSENDLQHLDNKGQLKGITQKISDMAKAMKEYEHLSKKYSYQVLYNKLYPEILQQTDKNKSNFTSATPISVKAPRYPRKALKLGLTGWVTTKFTLDPLGKPRDIRIVQEVPKQLFHYVAIKAIKKWRFKPVTDINGKPTWADNVRYTIEFKFNKQPVYNKWYFNKAYSKAKTGDPIAQMQYAYLKQNVPSYDFTDDKSSVEWYLSPAVKGVPFAQYALGESLVYGVGCKEDKSKGIQWLTRAASNGVNEASQLLAKLSLSSESKESQKTAIQFFKQSRKKDPSNMIQFAWLFATTKYTDLREPDFAIELVESLNSKKYNDDITKAEILAAAYAAKGNFKKAISYQEDALEEAEDGGFFSDDIQSHLTSYKENKTWF